MSEMHNGLVPTEVIPSLDLPKFQESLSTLDKLESELVPVEQEAKTLKVEYPDKAGFTRAGELTAFLKDSEKLGAATLLPFEKIVSRVKDFIQTRKNRHKNKTLEIRGILSQKMADWTRAEDTAAKAEDERRRKEATEAAERTAKEQKEAAEKQAAEIRKRKVAEIKEALKSGAIGKREANRMLKEAGAAEEAALVQADIDAEETKKTLTTAASEQKVLPSVPKVAGVVRRVNYSAECNSKKDFLRAFILAGNNPQLFDRLFAVIEVSNQLLSAEARKRIKTGPGDTNPAHDLTKEQFEKLYPFVTVKEDRTF